MHVLELPGDILGAIATALPFPDRLRLRLVSRAWVESVNASVERLTAATLRLDPSLYDQVGAQSADSDRGGVVQSASLPWWSILHHVSDVKVHLNLPRDIVGLISLLRNAQQLHTLELKAGSSVSWAVRSRLTRSALRACTQCWPATLRVFRFEHAFAQASFRALMAESGFSQLHELIVSLKDDGAVRAADTDVWAAVLSTCPNLRVLAISASPSLCNEVLRSLARDETVLQHASLYKLRLASYEPDSQRSLTLDANLPPALLKLPSLTCLRVGPVASPACVLAALRPQLESLVLELCDAVDCDALVDALLEHKCVRLRKLGLTVDGNDDGEDFGDGDDDAVGDAASGGPRPDTGALVAPARLSALLTACPHLRVLRLPGGRAVRRLYRDVLAALPPARTATLAEAVHRRLPLWGAGAGLAARFPAVRRVSVSRLRAFGGLPPGLRSLRLHYARTAELVACEPTLLPALARCTQVREVSLLVHEEAQTGTGPGSAVLARALSTVARASSSLRTVLCALLTPAAIEHVMALPPLPHVRRCCLAVHVSMHAGAVNLLARVFPHVRALTLLAVGGALTQGSALLRGLSTLRRLRALEICNQDFTYELSALEALLDACPELCEFGIEGQGRARDPEQLPRVLGRHRSRLNRLRLAQSDLPVAGALRQLTEDWSALDTEAEAW